MECELSYAGRCDLRRFESRDRYWKNGERSSIMVLQALSSRRHTIEKKNVTISSPLGTIRKQGPSVGGMYQKKSDHEQ